MRQNVTFWGVVGYGGGYGMKVNVETFEGRLRLRWRYSGRRYCLALGLPDRPINRIVATQKAAAIEADLATGNFDSSLQKYKPQPLQPAKSDDLSLVDLFERFRKFKAGTDINKRTLAKYDGLLPRLRDYFRDQAARGISQEDAESFRLWLLRDLQPVTVRERIGLLSAAFNWAVDRGWLAMNPFAGVKVKLPPQAPPSVFSEGERRAICEAFRRHPHYSHYADYVEFAFYAGCRPGELIGLRWRSVSGDNSQIYIWESVSRGERKTTKTGKNRTIALNQRLTAILEKRREVFEPQPDDLVFPAPGGGTIDDHNFRNRAWRRILTELRLEYRKPYSTRHTAHSHLLDQGWSPAEVAETMGNSVRVVYSRYAANVRGRRKLPD